MDSRREELLDQWVIKCCIDRLSWQEFTERGFRHSPRHEDPGNLSSSFASFPVADPEPDRSHDKQQAEQGGFRLKAVAPVASAKGIVVRDQQQQDADKDGNNPHECSADSSDGARFVVLDRGERNLAVRLT